MAKKEVVIEDRQVVEGQDMEGHTFFRRKPLYKITSDMIVASENMQRGMEELIDENGEIKDFAMWGYLDNMMAEAMKDLPGKIDSYAGLYFEHESEAERIKSQLKKLEKRQKFHESFSKRMKEGLQEHMVLTKVDEVHGNVFKVKVYDNPTGGSEMPEVIDLENWGHVKQIPFKYLKVSIRAADIIADFKTGVKIPVITIKNMVDGKVETAKVAILNMLEKGKHVRINPL